MRRKKTQTKKEASHVINEIDFFFSLQKVNLFIQILYQLVYLSSVVITNDGNSDCDADDLNTDHYIAALDNDGGDGVYVDDGDTDTNIYVFDYSMNDGYENADATNDSIVTINDVYHSSSSFQIQMVTNFKVTLRTLNSPELKFQLEDFITSSK
ncbi:unnamed protein product [Heterobilharzia americana]|nr:unnamed protein product [Heterobilharzia americana]